MKPQHGEEKNEGIDAKWRCEERLQEIQVAFGRPIMETHTGCCDQDDVGSPGHPVCIVAYSLMQAVAWGSTDSSSDGRRFSLLLAFRKCQ